MNEKSIGKVFEGWETDGVLGSGTFGTVYLAHTSVENMPVYGAVKVIKIPPNDEAIANAERMGISRDLLKTYFGKFKTDLNWETTMYNTISCPNLVRTEEMKTDDHPVAGWTGYLRTGVFTPMEVYFEKVHSGAEDAVRLGAELSSALMALEAKKLVHGDIKPENVMVADNGSFMLSDFAIKRCLQKAGANLFGSMSTDFEAPEVQGEEKSYTNLSDIYSLGVLMSYVANDCALTMSGKPEEVEGLDPKLAEIIKKAADPDPQARYQTAAELNKAITSLELYRSLKPHRRAVAAAASFELVKKNGSTIRGVSADAPETDEKIKFPNDPIEARKKKRMSLAGKIISTFVTVAAVAALVWFVAADPAGIIRGTGSESVIKDTETKEDEHKDITIIDEGKKTEDETGDKQDEQQPDPAAQEHDENPAENPAENPTENPSENPTEDPNENPGAEPSGEEPVPVEPDPVDPEPIDEPEPEPEPVYLMPSDTRIIKYSELEGLDKREAILVLNEVYARHGRAFKTDWIREYFESQSWYKATSKSDATINAELSKTENANLKTINQYLKDKGYR